MQYYNVLYNMIYWSIKHSLIVEYNCNMDKIELNIDSILEQLLSVRSNKPGKLVKLS